MTPTYRGLGPVDTLSDVVRGALNRDFEGIDSVASTLDDDEVVPLIVLLAHSTASALLILRGRDGANEVLDRLAEAGHL